MVINSIPKLLKIVGNASTDGKKTEGKKLNTNREFL